VGNNRDETIRVNYDVTGQDKIKGAQDAMRGVADAEAVATAAHEKEEISLTALSEKYAILEKGIGLFKELALTVGGLVAFEKVKEEIGAVLDTGDKFEKWGIQFKNAFGGAEAGAEAFEKIKTLAEATPYSLDVVTDAAIKMKRQGLDPLDGSLQTLIDTNAKYGGSTDQLTGLIDTFSKAAARGELNTRLLVTLQQQGVPAAKLLGDAMGVTAEKINDMAKNGELGRTSIALLLQKLAEANGGAAANAMGTLSSQVTKLRDQWDEFLELIAKSGVYDFAKDELRQVGEAIQQGLGDGSLQAKAQAISDAIVSLGKAAASTVQFLYDHAAAIKEVAEAYAVFKAGSLAIDITNLGLRAAESAALMVKFGGAGGEAAIAAGKVAENAARAGRDLGTFGERATTAAAAAGSARSGLLGIIAAIGAFDVVKLAEFADLLREDRRATDALAEAQRTVDRMLAERPARLAAVAAAAQVATEKQVLAEQKLSDAAIATTSVFEQLGKRGASAAEAVQGAFTKIEIKTPEGLKDIQEKIVGIEETSNDAADAVESELIGSLEKLNALDLSDFQHSIEHDLAQSLVFGKGSAEALTQELQAGLQAELLKVGESAEEAGVKFTQVGQQIITTFRAITENAQASGQQIGEAFEHGLSKVATSGEVQALQDQLKRAFEQGKISAHEFALASEEAANRLREIADAADPVTQALQRLHVVSQSALQDIANNAQVDFQIVRDASDGSAKSIADQQNAFLAYARARLAASAQLGAAARQQADVELESQAAILGITGALADLEKQSDSSQAATTSDADRAAAALQREYEAAQRLANRFSGGKGSIADSAKDAGDNVKDMAGGGGESLNQLDNALALTRQSFLSVSDAAAKAFDTRLEGDFKTAIDSAGNGALGFSRVLIAMNEAAADTATEIAGDRTQLQGMIENLNTLGAAGNKTFGSFGKDAVSATANIQTMIDAVQNGTYTVGILGQQDLQPLLQALEAAKQRADAAAQAAAAAANQFDQLAKSIHDQLLQEQGDQKALEDERHQEALAQLKAEADAGQIDQAKYQQAVADENALHQLKMQHLQDQQNQQNNGGSNSGGGGSSGSGSGPNKPSGGGSNGGGSSSGGAAVPVGPATNVVHIHLGDDVATVTADDKNRQMLRDILAQLRFDGSRT
jgi:tape measure domain-containing protein